MLIINRKKEWSSNVDYKEKKRNGVVMLIINRKKEWSSNVDYKEKKGME
ncbi:hypothetical protein MBCUT_15480 [Methanobrevibacter cuticularis]|uniref:Uncharacterized protein n=1 Tax=Methanobrevibacter cuticularis TaxID=47311 RepID=A0A166DBM7_9EURY|nr:hypothetical protein [Methanobrevibacter cuticularis]KZX15415.1 hypothetical protein MBCUT_15480 [Methanobrevibacter cuticularis]